MSNHIITRNEKLHVFLFAILSFLLHVAVIYKFSGWFSTDTDGYWLHAASFLGKDWSGVSRNMNYYYSWGYSLLLTIPMLLTDIPTRMLKISVIINSLLCAGVVPLAYYIVRRIGEKLTHVEAVLCCFAVSVYSSFMVAAGVSLSECFIYFTYFFSFACLVAYMKTEKNMFGVLLGFGTGFLYIIHNRNIGIIVAFMVTMIVFLFLKKNLKKNLFVIVPFLFSIVLKVCIDKWLKITEAAENIYTKNTYSSMLDKYIHHRSFYRIVSIFENVLGEYWYTCIGTFFIAGIGVWYLCYKIMQYRKKEETEVSYLVICLYALLSWLFSVGVSAVAIAKMESDPNGRIDILIYGRYMECTIGVLMLFGFVCLLEIRKEYMKKSFLTFLCMFLSLAAISIIVYLISLNSDPYKCNWFSVVAILFPFNRSDMKVSILLASILLGGLGVAVTFCLLRKSKIFHFAGYFMISAMFLYIGYNTTNQVSAMYAEGKSIVNNPIYNEYFSDICKYINDNNQDSLYVYAADGYEAFSYQFMNPSVKVVGITTQEELSKLSSDCVVLMKLSEIPTNIVYEMIYSNGYYGVFHVNAQYGGMDANQLCDAYNLQLERIVIDIPTVEKEYDFLCFSDNQANFDNREDLGWFGSSQNRVFVDANGVSSADNFDHFIQFANKSGVNGVLLGGDIIDFASETNLSVLKEKLSQLEGPYLFTYGNHDSYVPWENQFYDDNKQFLDLFSSTDNCEFQKLELEGVTIVSIKNYQKDGTANISNEALQQFKTVCNQGTPIILMLHVPIYTEYANGLANIDGYEGLLTYCTYDAGDFGTVFQSRLMGENCGYDLTDETKEFLNLVLDKDSPVCFVLAGHLHQSWNGKITDNIGEYVLDGAFKNKGIILEIR
ncbi:MAG: metallophosphoesterase family protein [Lachnospiraceae bacterium]